MKCGVRAVSGFIGVWRMLTNRDGAQGTLTGNITNARAGWFVNPAAADLHLLATTTAAIDRAAALADVTDDLDGDRRPIGPAPDVGADEYGVAPPTLKLFLPIVINSAVPHEVAEEIILFHDISSINLAVDPANIQGASMDGDRLSLRVTYSGGCWAHELDLYGSTAFLESYPVQADVFLSHDAKDDPCDALIREQLFYDLLPLKQAYHQAYGPEGPLLLRIHEPGATEPVRPLVRYDF